MTITRALVRRTDDGRALLNVGCGGHFAPEWTNIDVAPRPGVLRHDLRRPLPFQDALFDGVYASHVLEHLDEEEGRTLLSELFRVSKPGGVARIIVPDFERACREYLARLEEVRANPESKQRMRYRWSLLEVIDQYSRRRPGGKMLQTLQSGDMDPDYVRARNGAEFEPLLAAMADVTSCTRRPAGEARTGPIRRLKRWVYRQRFRLGDGVGELHRWAYDSFSLPEALRAVGFEDTRIVPCTESRMGSWLEFGLDADPVSRKERKPDSLYVEGVRPRCEACHLSGATITNPLHNDASAAQ